MRDTVRTQLWPLPVVAVVVALVGGVLLPHLDSHVDASLPSWLSSILFGGDPGAARTVLDAVSSSLITVTSLTFSLTVVTLQLASSQFSPRLLRTFTSDVFVQATLGLFLATFTYSLTVLRTVRSGDKGVLFVPRIAVTGSFLLAVFSVLGLVLFLAHLARQIRVETMLKDVHEDASATLTTVLGPRPDHPPAAIPPAPSRAVTLCAAASGFVVRFSESDLLKAAVGTNSLIVLDCHPGSSLVRATPIGQAWSLDGELSAADSHRLGEAVGEATVIGFERTAAQDVGYGLRQLADVANKALSPGINDPTTAIHALGHIAALLCDLSDRDLGTRVLSDDDGHPRVWLRRPDLAQLVDQSVSQPRRYGASDAQVLSRLFLLLEQLAWRVALGQLHVIEPQLRRLHATATASEFDGTEAEQLATAHRRVQDVLNARRSDPEGARS